MSARDAAEALTGNGADDLIRDAIRIVQEARKNAGLDSGDRIVLAINVAPGIAPAMQRQADRIANETGADAVAIEPTEQIADIIDDIRSPGDGVFISRAKTLGSDKSEIIVTIDATGTWEANA